MTDELSTSKPTLTGERVILRPFEPADIDAMGAILADPEVIRLTGSASTTEETLGKSPILDARTREWYETRAAQTDRLDLAIVDKETGVCVGESVLNEWSPEDESVNFRILIGEAGRGRGLGTEATRLTLEHAFTDLGLNRVALEVFAFNPRARRAYEKAGFVHEGTKREAFVFDGERINAEVMSVLRSDWVNGAI